MLSAAPQILMQQERDLSAKCVLETLRSSELPVSDMQSDEPIYWTAATMSISTKNSGLISFASMVVLTCIIARLALYFCCTSLHLVCLEKHKGVDSCHSLLAGFLCHTMHPMLCCTHLLPRQCFEGMSTPEQQTKKLDTICSSDRGRHNCQTFSMFFLQLPPSSSILSISFKTCKYFETD
jgi:hypothetical protein